MALPSNQLRVSGTEKGKAVHIAHTWKDHLWDMGAKSDIPEDTLIETQHSASANEADSDDDGEEEDEESHSNVEDVQPATPPPDSEPPSSTDVAPSNPTTGGPSTVTFTAEEVTELLNRALYQAIFAHLKSLPTSAFPIPATQFYSNYILPSRPAFPTLVLPPAGLTVSVTDANKEKEPPVVETEISIKTSTHKSLTTFLKAAEKNGLITLKPSQKKSQPDVLITSVNAKHPSVVGHASFVTLKDVEVTAAKKAAREEKQRESNAHKEVEIKELWKPHQDSIELFEGMGGRYGRFFFLGYFIATKLNLTHYWLLFFQQERSVLCYRNQDDAELVHIITQTHKLGRSGVHQPRRSSVLLRRCETEIERQEQGHRWSRRDRNSRVHETR